MERQEKGENIIIAKSKSCHGLLGIAHHEPQHVICSTALLIVDQMHMPTYLTLKSLCFLEKFKCISRANWRKVFLYIVINEKRKVF